MRRLVFWLALAGCVNTDVVGHLGGAGGTSGGGPGSNPASLCGGRVAEQTFRYALCVCEQAQLHELRTNVVDAVSGATAASGAAVGLNRSFDGQGFSNVGSLFVSGNLSLSNQYNVNGDLKVAGMFGAGNGNQVVRDAWIGGAINLPQNGLSVGRDFYAPGPDVPYGVSVWGQMHQSNVRVDLPCDCNGLDILGLASAAARINDDGPIGLDPAAVGSDLALPAGRFYINAITSPLTLHVSERTMLFTSGDVDGSALSVDLGATGELDLFVGGSLLAMVSGSDPRPAALRVYVAGSQEIALAVTSGGMGASQSDFTGYLYAPAARVSTTAGQMFVHGALFAGALSANDLSIHYDADIGNAAASCPTSSGDGASCKRCQDCTGGSACVQGVCGACSSDADCCAPLTCSATGRCEPLHP